MDGFASRQLAEQRDYSEQRSAPRYISLIRAAKLLTPAGEFVCVVRDVSSSGVKVKLFHRLPAADGQVALELQNGERFELHLARMEAEEASFTFIRPVAVERLIREHWAHPKRQFRLAMTLPIQVIAQGAEWEGEIINLSQQGARLRVGARLATDQLVRIVAAQLPEIHAKVRWHRQDVYGVVFEETFSLAQIARLAAQVQCPGLLDRAY